MLDCALATPTGAGGERAPGGAGASVSMDVLPHVMLVPSDLGVFAKRFAVRRRGGGGGAAAREHAVVGVNPGRLTRGAGGGTYALLKVPCPGRALDMDIAGGTSAHILKI